MRNKETISGGFPWFHNETSVVMNYTFGCRINNSMHVICTKPGAFKSRVFAIYLLQARHVLQIEALAWQCKPTQSFPFARSASRLLQFAFYVSLPKFGRDSSLLWHLFHFTLLQICMCLACRITQKKRAEKRNEIREISFLLPCRLESNVKRQEEVQIVMTNVSDSL